MQIQRIWSYLKSLFSKHPKPDELPLDCLLDEMLGPKYPRHEELLTEEKSSSLIEVVTKNGGMINCGSHMGVFVGTDMNGTPPGWVFIDLETATIPLVQQAVIHAKKGRDSWPKKPSNKRKKNTDEILDEVFDSQDYIGS